MTKYIFNQSEYESTIPEFKDILLSLESKYSFFNYKGDARSVSNSELSCLYYFLKKYRPESFFESGAWWGRCSFIIAESMKRLDLQIPYYIAHLHKEERLETLSKDYPNIIARKEYGEKLAFNIKESRMGLFIDGPKWRMSNGKRMRILYKGLALNNTDILFAFHHDVGQWQKLDRTQYKRFIRRHDDKYLTFDFDSVVKQKHQKILDLSIVDICTSVLINRNLNLT